MELEDWLKVFLYVAPVAALVLNKCKRMGLNPGFPVAGLVLGLLLELRR